MGRRFIVTVKEIDEQRARWWDRHYQNRRTAQQLTISGWNAATIIEALHHHMTVPRLNTLGGFKDSLLADRKLSPVSMLRVLGWNAEMIGLLCVWYWSEIAWADFVIAFQSLPEVQESHYYAYDVETDVIELVPMSSRAKRMYKSSTSHVQDPDLYIAKQFKSRRAEVVPVER